jgi:hypothetical protein
MRRRQLADIRGGAGWLNDAYFHERLPTRVLHFPSLPVDRPRGLARHGINHRFTPFTSLMTRVATSVPQPESVSSFIDFKVRKGISYKITVRALPRPIENAFQIFCEPDRHIDFGRRPADTIFSVISHFNRYFSEDA